MKNFMYQSDGSHLGNLWKALQRFQWFDPKVSYKKGTSWFCRISLLQKHCSHLVCLMQHSVHRPKVPFQRWCRANLRKPLCHTQNARTWSYYFYAPTATDLLHNMPAKTHNFIFKTFSSMIFVQKNIRIIYESLFSVLF